MRKQQCVASIKLNCRETQSSASCAGSSESGQLARLKDIFSLQILIFTTKKFTTQHKSVLLSELIQACYSAHLDLGKSLEARRAPLKYY